MGVFSEHTRVMKLTVGKFETIIKNKKLTDSRLFPVELHCLLEGMTIKLQLTKPKKAKFCLSVNGVDY